MQEIIGQTREGWAKMVHDSKVDLWLALSGDRLVGVQGYWKNDPEADALLLPEHCVSLKIAGTRPEARRRGIARALMQIGLTHSQRQGFFYCETDWRSANLLARHCWPKLEFAPYAYRLVRWLDDRISWACGDHA
ncbi:MAG TPA: GNAT family N-acetyltransferase [Chthonomonadales bacterium]|nr:GNAT family N-acetyltransferase [Chthonomonadales bacterium]